MVITLLMVVSIQNSDWCTHQEKRVNHLEPICSSGQGCQLWGRLLIFSSFSSNPATSVEDTENSHKDLKNHTFFRCATISRLYPCQSLGRWIGRSFKLRSPKSCHLEFLSAYHHVNMIYDLKHVIMSIFGNVWPLLATFNHYC